MASSDSVLCGPCQEEKVNTKAELWCNNCDEGLCSTCSSHHKRIKSSRDHKTIDIETYKNYKPHTGFIKTECHKHVQQLNLYCPSHLIPCCDECISTSHSKCTGIKSLASVVDKSKFEKSKESVEKDINSLLLFMDKMVHQKSRNIRRGEQQYGSISEYISKFRTEINRHLDNLETKLCKEANTLWRLEKTKLTSLITEIEEKKKTLKDMQDALKTVTEHSSKLQSFLGVHRIEQKVHQFLRYFEDMEDSERVSEVDIKIIRNDEIDNILGKVQSLTSLGEVNVVKTGISVKRKSNVKREAQIESREQSIINNIKMHIETEIEINISADISDMICLMDGRVIVVEWYGEVNLLTSDGKFQKHLPIPGEACSVTQINQDNIAITYPKEKAIKIFNMESETVAKGIILDKGCFGLSFSNNSLAVGMKENEIRIIDLEGNLLKSIQLKSKSLWYIVYCNNSVIYSDYFRNGVYCVDGSGKQIWQYKQDLKGPQGLSSDTYGNIIVADRGSNKLIVITQDGQDSKVLISEIDRMNNPKCICFKHNESSGFICDVSGTSLTKFNLSYG